MTTPQNDDPFEQGLAADLQTDGMRSVLGRRRLLRWTAAAAAGTLVGSRFDGGLARAALTEIPEETAGPYPGDGSNGPNVLTQSGVVRRDIRSSFGSATGTAQGVPLTLRLRLLDTTNDGVLQGFAVYLWHCDRDGNYSLYSSGVTNQNYLRGVQASDDDGYVTFTSIFPGCYSGRWPHVHFEVYPSLAKATASGNKIATSQLALPQATCATVYATTGYSKSVTNLAQVTLSTDNVFRDGWSAQLATVTGDATNGYVATLDVPIDADGAGVTGTTGSEASDTTVTPTTSPASIGSSSAYRPLSTPTRLLDTRAASLVGATGTKPTAGTITEVQVLGRAGVPTSGVAAVVVNVAATETDGAGFVTVWGDGTQPGTSALNLDATGQTRSNLVTTPVGADGRIRLYTYAGTHLVADVVGYFQLASTATAGRLLTVTPARVLDTRPASAVAATGAKPAAGSTVVVPILGQQGIPSSGVSAVVLNLVATEATAAGYVTAWASGTRPGTANLNAERAGQTIGNQVIVPVGGDGAIRLYTQSGTHLVADVTGWFTDDTAASATDGLFVPVQPYRVLDTRSGTRPAAGSTITLLAATSGSAAAGASALAMNVTATDAAAAGFVTIWPEGARPTTASLNVSGTTETIGNHVVMAAGSDGGVRLFTQSGTHLVVDVTGWYR